MYTHTVSPNSRTGYDLIRRRFLKSLSGGSLGMSTHWPVVSNFQPW